jgi:hypothetical protein
VRVPVFEPDVMQRQVGDVVGHGVSGTSAGIARAREMVGKKIDIVGGAYNLATGKIALV